MSASGGPRRVRRIPRAGLTAYLVQAGRHDLIRTLAAVVILGLAACGQGGSGLLIKDAEFRPPLGVTGIGVAYVSVTSGAADRIIGVTSSQADRVEIHASVTTGTQTSMKRLDSVELPAGKTVIFGPGGMHLMVFSPRLAASDATFPIQIKLQSGRSETILFHPALMGSGKGQ